MSDVRWRRMICILTGALAFCLRNCGVQLDSAPIPSMPTCTTGLKYWTVRSSPYRKVSDNAGSSETSISRSPHCTFDMPMTRKRGGTKAPTERQEVSYRALPVAPLTSLRSGDPPGGTRRCRRFRPVLTDAASSYREYESKETAELPAYNPSIPHSVPPSPWLYRASFLSSLNLSSRFACCI